MMNAYKPDGSSHVPLWSKFPSYSLFIDNKYNPSLTDLIKLEETQSLKMATYMVVEHFDGAPLALTTS